MKKLFLVIILTRLLASTNSHASLCPDGFGAEAKLVQDFAQLHHTYREKSESDPALASALKEDLQSKYYSLEKLLQDPEQFKKIKRQIQDKIDELYAHSEKETRSQTTKEKEARSKERVVVNWESTQYLKDLGKRVSMAAFIPNQNKLVIDFESTSNAPIIYDLSTKKQTPIPEHQTNLTQIEVSPNQKTLLTLSDKAAVFLDLKTKKTKIIRPSINAHSKNDEFGSVRFSPDGTMAAFTYRRGGSFIYDLSTSKVIFLSKDLRVIDFASENGEVKLITRNSMKKIELCSLSFKIERTIIRKFSNDAFLRLSPDKQTLFLPYDKKPPEVLEIATGKITKLEGPEPSKGLEVAFSKDSKKISIIDANNEGYLFHLDQPSTPFKWKHENADKVAFHPNGNEVISYGIYSETVLIHQTSTSNQIQLRMKYNPGSLEMSPDGKMMLMILYDPNGSSANIEIWEPMKLHHD